MFQFASKRTLTQVLDGLFSDLKPSAGKLIIDASKHIRVLLVKTLKRYFNNDGTISALMIIDKNHACSESGTPRVMTFHSGDVTSPSRICDECIIRVMLNHLSLHFKKLPTFETSHVGYTMLQLSQICMGFILTYVRATEPIPSIGKDDLMVYPSDHAFKYVMGKSAISYGVAYTVEPLNVIVMFCTIIFIITSKNNHILG